MIPKKPLAQPANRSSFFNQGKAYGMERPNLSIRSTRGCWTCRLRKKKCDEVQPGCLRCASVNIDCHYGTKPAWIEDPARGKEELDRVKKIVAVAASRKRAEHRARVKSGSISRSESQGQPATALEDGIVSQQSPSAAIVSPTSQNVPIPATPGNDVAWLVRWNSQEEANLIMHYLDHVFYIQFRFYSPTVSEPGRGWFLSLLTRTKPLYHAALR